MISNICSRNKVLVERLLSSMEVNVNQSDQNGYTHLIWAVDKGGMEIVKIFLCLEDTNGNRQDNNGYTALMWAAVLGNTRCVRKLLK